MFDLDKAISAWRRTLEHTRAVSAEDLRELECHVRDQVDWLRAEGYGEEDAFARAVREAGDFGTTAEAYEKVYWRKARHRGRFLSTLSMEAGMLANYLKTALRNLRRQPGYTLLNVAGLAVGLACCLLIAVYVRHEHSYDRFHAKADRIFRVVTHQRTQDTANETVETPMAAAATLQADLPEVEAAVRLGRGWNGVLRNGDRQHHEGRIYFTDPNVFDVFDIEVLRGDPATALQAPNSIVLTDAAARRYFGEEDPLGQTLTYSFIGSTELVVTAVARPMPDNSHFHFDFLIPYAFHPFHSGERSTQWDYTNQPTYLLLAEGQTADAVEARLPDFVARRYTEPARSAVTLTLQPLPDIHLHSHLRGEFEPGGSPRLLYLLSAVAMLILVIACINFMNLATARSAERAREVGVRKVVGARRAELVGQFLAESVVLAGLSVVLAFGLAWLMLPVFNDLADRRLTLIGQGGDLAILLAGLALATGLAAGSYPAFFLSAFEPVRVLKGRPATSGGCPCAKGWSSPSSPSRSSSWPASWGYNNRSGSCRIRTSGSIASSS